MDAARCEACSVMAMLHRAAVATCFAAATGMFCVFPAAVQAQPGRSVNDGLEDLLLKPPSAEQLFRAESESKFLQRVVNASAPKGGKAILPVDAPPLPPTGEVRQAPLATALYAPTHVCYQPLYFENKNAERYAWTVPGLQPLIATGRFYLKTALLPISLGLQPPWTEICNTGYPLPGDSVPFRRHLLDWLPEPVVTESD